MIDMNPTKNLAFFVLDNVLFDARHRASLVPEYRDSPDADARAASWDAYWARSIDDTPLPAMAMVAGLINQGFTVLLSSGRPEAMHDATKAKVEMTLTAYGADPQYFDNIRYDLRVDGENYVEKSGRLVKSLWDEGQHLIIAIVKNNGLAANLRRTWPLATVCNVGREAQARR